MCHNSVCQKPWNFPLVLSNAAARQLEFRSTPLDLFSLKLMFECSKSESLHDVSMKRIGDTLSYGFPQTELESFALISLIDPHILPKVGCVY